MVSSPSYMDNWKDSEAFKNLCINIRKHWTNRLNWQFHLFPLFFLKFVISIPFGSDRCVQYRIRRRKWLGKKKKFFFIKLFSLMISRQNPKICIIHRLNTHTHTRIAYEMGEGAKKNLNSIMEHDQSYFTFALTH